MKKEDNVFDFLYAFPKYRRLKNRLKVVNKDNRALRKNWEEQIIINENLKEKINKKDKLISSLKKELKELRKSE